MLLNIIKSLQVFRHYSYLLRQLVARDFKVKYKRSVLGVAWSVLNPLFTMIILDIVFNELFHMAQKNIVDYPVYLLTGILLFNFFSEATNLSNGAVVTNFNLLTKVYIPKYIFPMSKVLSSAINMLFSLIALYLIVIEEVVRTHVMHVPVTQIVNITWTHLLLPYDLICMTVFCIGLGLLLSALTVFFRDMFYIWGVLLTAWNYLTPIIYAEDMVKTSYFYPLLKVIFHLNPLYYFVGYAHTIILYNQVPTLKLHLACAACAILMLVIGALFFRHNQDKFIYHI
jgi:ABC-type polysaccharide/polyol phosphate export systems, permease component